MRSVQEATEKTVATTYWGEIEDEPKTVIPYIKSPYLHDPELKVPHLVLTKTFCSTDCESCMPVPLTEKGEFRKGCRSFTAKEPATGQFIKDHFTERLVSKAIYFVRNPFNIIIDRMKGGLNVRAKNETEWPEERLSQFNDTTEGIMAWCNHLDSIYDPGYLGNETYSFEKIMERRKISPELYTNLPCHTEWFRMVQFHNLAIKTLQEMEIPTLLMYFEEYERKTFKETVRKLLNFMELKQVDDFVSLPNPSKTFVDRYSDEYAITATKFVRALASDDCWEIIQHYFDEWIDDALEQEEEEEEDGADDAEGSNNEHVSSGSINNDVNVAGATINASRQSV